MTALQQRNKKYQMNVFQTVIGGLMGLIAAAIMGFAVFISVVVVGFAFSIMWLFGMPITLTRNVTVDGKKRKVVIGRYRWFTKV